MSEGELRAAAKLRDQVVEAYRSKRGTVATEGAASAHSLAKLVNRDVTPR